MKKNDELLRKLLNDDAKAMTKEEFRRAYCGDGSEPEPDEVDYMFKPLRK